MERLTCYFSGQVQGVGFRYTVERIARDRPIAGYVRNLPDGRVEVVMEGQAELLDDLVRDVQQKMEGFIRETQCQKSVATGEYDRFVIRHG